jgi:hypothetical protein
MLRGEPDDKFGPGHARMLRGGRAGSEPG